MSAKKIAVVLFQLGGPDSLGAVEPFLFNLFMDPDIINFPFARIFRRPLARFISSRRSKKAAGNYAQIGGKSPILELTNAQAEALQVKLAGSMNSTVLVAMRYWHPLTSPVAEKVKAGGFDEIILLPLYPQYSITTSGSSINEWNRERARVGLDGVRQKIVDHFYDNPNYIDAVVDNINRGLKKFSGVEPERVQLVFSAHGVPLSIIAKGDPYQRQIEATVRSALERGQWRHPHVLCYQSKVGPAKWLQPSLNETIDSLASKGARHLLVIPIAFVTDHIETLHEINIETRHRAQSLGITHFEMTAGLNDHPKLIEALADEVLKLAREE
jgi:ferrochelatase